MQQCIARVRARVRSLPLARGARFSECRPRIARLLCRHLLACLVDAVRGATERRHWFLCQATAYQHMLQGCAARETNLVRGRGSPPGTGRMSATTNEAAAMAVCAVRAECGSCARARACRMRAHAGVATSHSRRPAAPAAATAAAAQAPRWRPRPSRQAAGKARDGRRRRRCRGAPGHAGRRQAGQGPAGPAQTHAAAT